MVRSRYIVMQAGLPNAFPIPLSAISVRSETEVENIGLSAFHVGDLGAIRYSVSGQIHSSRAEISALALTTSPLPDFIAPAPAAILLFGL